MPYNPTIHHRRTIRLKGYDYSQAGLYFVTICCQNNVCRFGRIENGEMILNDFGKIAYDEWMKLPERYTNMILDVFQIMPNHIHGIIALGDTMAGGVGATLAVALNDGTVAHDVGATLAVAQNAVAQNADARDNRATARVARTNVSVVDNGATARVARTNKCLEIYKLRNEYMGKLWLRDYWEHIIRNEQSYQNIENYIINNPVNWGKDKYYTE
jgi:REP element-mobilizing transposase RayT